MVTKSYTPPTSLRCDLKTSDIKAMLDMKFDVIMINPPLQEYCRRAPTAKCGKERTYWSWKEIVLLPSLSVSCPPS